MQSTKKERNTITIILRRKEKRPPKAGGWGRNPNTPLYKNYERIKDYPRITEEEFLYNPQHYLRIKKEAIEKYYPHSGTISAQFRVPSRIPGKQGGGFSRELILEITEEEMLRKKPLPRKL